MTLEEYFSRPASASAFACEELYFGKLRRVREPSEEQLRLFANLAIHLGSQLRASSCQIQTDQVRIFQESSQNVRACGACLNEGMPEYHALDRLHSAFGNPRAIIDFPQNEDEAAALHADFERSYRLLPSLWAYLLVYQAQRRIEVWMRNRSDETWQQVTLHETHPRIELGPFGVVLDLCEIYDEAV